MLLRNAYLHVPPVLPANLVEGRADLSKGSDFNDLHQLGENIATSFSDLLQAFERSGGCVSVLGLKGAQVLIPTLFGLTFPDYLTPFASLSPYSDFWRTGATQVAPDVYECVRLSGIRAGF